MIIKLENETEGNQVQEIKYIYSEIKGENKLLGS